MWRLVVIVSTVTLLGCPGHPPRRDRGPQNLGNLEPVSCPAEGRWTLALTAIDAPGTDCKEILADRIELVRSADGWQLGDYRTDLDAESPQACRPHLHVVGQGPFFAELGAESGEIAFELVVTDDGVTGTARTVVGYEDRTCTQRYEVASTGASTPAARGEVECGTDTCGADEYCEVRCTCCGARLPEPGETSSEQSCMPLPDSCKSGDGPECQERTVHRPCA